jgi:hypothetical protein
MASVKINQSKSATAKYRRNGGGNESSISLAQHQRGMRQQQQPRSSIWHQRKATVAWRFWRL